MTITVDIKPEVQAELARQAAACGREVEADAAFAEIRGLLTDEEVDQMFTRNPSTARPVDLS